MAIIGSVRIFTLCIVFLCVVWEAHAQYWVPVPQYYQRSLDYDLDSDYFNPYYSRLSGTIDKNVKYVRYPVRPMIKLRSKERISRSGHNPKLAPKSAEPAYSASASHYTPPPFIDDTYLFDLESYPYHPYSNSNPYYPSSNPYYPEPNPEYRKTATALIPEGKTTGNKKKGKSIHIYPSYRSEVDKSIQDDHSAKDQSVQDNPSGENQPTQKNRAEENKNTQDNRSEENKNIPDNRSEVKIRIWDGRSEEDERIWADGSEEGERIWPDSSEENGRTRDDRSKENKRILPDHSENGRIRDDRSEENKRILPDHSEYESIQSNRRSRHRRSAESASIETYLADEPMSYREAKIEKHEEKRCSCENGFEDPGK